MVSHRKSDV